MNLASAARRIYTVALGLWAGGLLMTAVSVLNVFSLFEKNNAIEMGIASFRLQGFVGFVLIAVMMLCATRRKTLHWVEQLLLVGALLCALALHLWVIPQLLLARNSGEIEPLWHSLSSTLYLAQALIALVLLWMAGADRGADSVANNVANNVANSEAVNRDSLASDINAQKLNTPDGFTDSFVGSATASASTGDGFNNTTTTNLRFEYATVQPTTVFAEPPRLTKITTDSDMKVDANANANIAAVAKPLIAKSTGKA